MPRPNGVIMKISEYSVVLVTEDRRRYSISDNTMRPLFRNAAMLPRQQHAHLGAVRRDAAEDLGAVTTDAIDVGQRMGESEQLHAGGSGAKRATVNDAARGRTRAFRARVQVIGRAGATT